MRKLMACVVALAATATANAAPIVINFDTLPGGAPLPNNSVLTNQYSSVGVTFSGFENNIAVSQPTATNAFSSEFGGPPVSGQVLENRDVNNNRADVIRFNFSSPTSGIEFDFLPFGSLGPNTLIQAFDSNGNLLHSSTIGGPASTNVNFHYILPVSGVSSFTMTQPDDGWVWGMDNLQFSQEVPEPISLLVFGGLVAGGGWLARRRMKATVA